MQIVSRNIELVRRLAGLTITIYEEVGYAL